MEKEYIKCQNCEESFENGFQFCPHCGQKAKDELTIGVLFYNTVSNYFSFDARFFKSFFPLLFKPGYLASKFIEGKRLLYLHPAQLYLFISVVFFFLLSTIVIRDKVYEFDTALKKTFDKPIINDSIKSEAKAKAEKFLDSVMLDSILKPLSEKGIPGMKIEEIKALDSLIRTNAKNGNNIGTSFDFDQKKLDSLISIGASDTDIHKEMGMGDNPSWIKRKLYVQVLKFYKQRNGGQIFQAAVDTIPISLFILLPIFAFILKILFYKCGRYSHHLVFSFYFFSFLFTVFSIQLVVNYFWDIPTWLDSLLIFSTIFYLFIAIKRFYGQGWVLSFFKTGLSTFIYFSFVIPIAIVIVGFAGFLFY
jgi:hypothetical protein